MSLVRLSRALRVPARSATGNAAALLLVAKPKAPSASLVSSSPPQQPLDETIARLYAALAEAGGGAPSASRLRAVHRLAAAAMEGCLAQSRPADAVDLYHTVCSVGLFPPATGASRALDRLAMRALRGMPHQTRSGLAIGQLLAAECEPEVLYAGSAKTAVPSPTSSPPSPSPTPTTPYPSLSLSLSLSPARYSEAEAFRIGLHQRTHLLRAVGQLRLPLGRNYFLSEARAVLDMPALRAEAEVEPLALISAGVLGHPFTHAQPPAAWAERVVLFDRLDLLSASATAGLSAAQREGVMRVEEAVSPLRPLCSPSLRFLTAVAADWDEVLHRRVAECLLLPAGAHDVFPPAYSEQRRRGRPARRRVWELADAEAARAALDRWTDPSHDLFPTVSPSTTTSHCPSAYDGAGQPLRVALARAEAIVRRRHRRGLVVPDAAFAIGQLPQLQRLGRHREVVLTHGVLLELVRVASLPSCPRRFMARRALAALARLTTTARTEAEAAAAGALPLAARRRGWDGGEGGAEAGVTVLGLQDEVALLECCRERAEVAAAEEDREGADRLCDDRLVRSTRVSAVLVAHQLGRMLALHARGSSLAATQGTATTADGEGPLLTDGAMDDLVQGIVSANGDGDNTDDNTDDDNDSVGPLFKSRSRAFWAGVPVVVATTDESTRVSAYMLGVQTYPPIASA